MATLANRAKVVTSTTGTGTITLGSAVTGFQTFSGAGVTDGQTVSYVIEEGTEWEVGTGVYSSTGPTLTRTPSESSNAGSAINLAGAAQVFVVATAEDLQRAADMDQGVATTDSVTFAGATVNGNITVTGTVDGRDVAADGTKLDGIEAGATADQTASEIKTAYESNANTNAFTDAEQSKLAGIEAGATADQTASEILTAVKTVDGAGSGLDADVLDGQQGSYYLDANNFVNMPAGYTGWTISDGTNSENVADGNTVTFASTGAASVAYNTTSNTLTIGATNTTYSAGTGLSLSGTTFTNTAPDQTVSLTGGGATTISGTYPNFTISSTDTNTVPNNATITLSAGTGLTGGGNFTTDQSANETITLNVNAGTSANQIVQLDGSARLPAVDGSQLTNIPGVPSGVIALWSGATTSVPSGWFLCDGANGTPDLRDRFIVGAGSSYAVGATGGASSVTLTTTQIPSHSHTGTTSSAGSHTHNITLYDAPYFTRVYRTGAIFNIGNGSQNTRTTASAGAHTHSFTTSTTGGGGSHENRPPYYALAYIMKG